VYGRLYPVPCCFASQRGFRRSEILPTRIPCEYRGTLMLVPDVTPRRTRKGISELCRPSFGRVRRRREAAGGSFGYSRGTNFTFGVATGIG
jgi:hypothetical protein